MRAFSGYFLVGLSSLIFWAAEVNAALTLTKVQDLNFIDAAPGDGTAAVPIGDTVHAAKFSITGGTAGRAFTVTLPAGNTNMANGGNTIVANTWTATANGTLDGTGAATIFIGATHAALTAGQATGNYTGAFTLNVRSHGVNAFSGGNAIINVITSISVLNLTNLAFGNCTINDPAKTVAAGSPNSAQFTVTGQPAKQYSIVLPASITMITGGGGTANQQIVVNAFTSSPASPGTIGGGGTQALSIGATRAAIHPAQTQGAYTASFTITLTYQ